VGARPKVDGVGRTQPGQTRPPYGVHEMGEEEVVCPVGGKKKTSGDRLGPGCKRTRNPLYYGKKGGGPAGVKTSGPKLGGKANMVGSGL